MLRNVVKGQCKTYHPLTELMVSDGDAAIARKQSLSHSSAVPYKNSYIHVNVDKSQVGKPLSLKAHVKYEPEYNISSRGYDHVVMDILNKSGEASQFRQWDKKTKSIIGYETEMKAKNVMPLLTGQVLLKTPTNGFYRPFNETDFPNQKLANDQLVYIEDFIKQPEPPTAAELDDGDTTWLD